MAQHYKNVNILQFTLKISVIPVKISKGLLKKKATFQVNLHIKGRAKALENLRHNKENQ